MNGTVSLLLFPWRALIPALRYLLTVFEELLTAGGNKALVASMVGLVVFWHVYTPIHELLHVGMCLAGGGSVTELTLKPQYGGVLLAKVFPFVVAESEYAGRLSGFTTPNDLVYALVDFAPYVLSLFGLTFVAWVRRNGRAWLFGLGLLLTLIPFMSIPGDYYEAASLVTTRLAALLDPTLPPRVLVSDDVFRSVGVLHADGLLDVRLALLVCLGCLGAIYMTLVTLAAQVWVAEKWLGRLPWDAVDAGETPAS